MQESAIAVSTPEIDARIDAQKRNLDSLLQRFTEQHPDVIGARRLIKELEEQKRKEVDELRRSSHGLAWQYCGRRFGQPGLPGDEPDVGHLRGAGGCAARQGGRVHRTRTTRRAR